MAATSQKTQRFGSTESATVHRSVSRPGSTTTGGGGAELSTTQPAPATLAAKSPSAPARTRTILPNTDGLPGRGWITSRGRRRLHGVSMADEIGRLVPIIDPLVPAPVVPAAVDIVDGLAAINRLRIGVDVRRRRRDDDISVRHGGGSGRHRGAATRRAERGKCERHS